jgi:outer membrane protein assembly factor BamB
VANGSLFAISTATGAINWEGLVNEAGATLGPLVDAQGYVYCASAKIDPSKQPSQDGFEVPSYARKHSFAWGAFSADESVIYGTQPQDGLLLAISTSTGDSLWSFEIDTFEGDRSYIWSQPVVDADGTVYIGTKTNSNVNGVFYALNPGDGSLKWKNTAIKSDMYCTAVIANDGNIYVGSENLTMHALDKSSGTILWELMAATAGDVIFGSPVIASNGVMYLATIGDNDSGTGGGISAYYLGESVGYELGAAWPRFRGNDRNLGRN